MAYWLQSKFGDGFQSTLNQLTTLTKELVDDIIPNDPYGYDMTQSKDLIVKRKMSSLNDRESQLIDQLNREIEYSCLVVIRDICDQACFSLELETNNEKVETDGLFINHSSITQESHNYWVLVELNSLGARFDRLLAMISDLQKYVYSIEKLCCSQTSSIDCLQRLDCLIKSFSNHCISNQLIMPLINAMQSRLRKEQLTADNASIVMNQNGFLSSEVNRLKSHLVDRHEQHNAELSKSVGKYNEALEEIAAVRFDNEQMLMKIQSISEERDFLRDKLQEEQTKCSRQLGDERTKLSEQVALSKTLQNTLIQQHEDMKKLLSSIKERHMREIGDLNKQLVTNLSKDAQIVEPVIHSPPSENHLSDLSKENKILHDHIRFLKFELILKEQERAAFEQTLTNISPTIGNRIEKSLSRELLLSFLRLPIDKRSEAVPALAQVLEFSKDQIAELTKSQRSTDWSLSSFFRTSESNSRDHLIIADPTNEPSLAELLVKYVDKETRPQIEAEFFPTLNNNSSGS